ncbi:MAG: SRPBCC family protein [Actinomycetales bacterium]|nr:SRPBCC family protein [Actinomycetales bacterium]
MANRELITATIEVDATPEQVWALVSDLQRMGEWSPQCHRMFVRGGDVALGTRTLNINHEGKLWWPTRSQVIEFEPNRRISFKILENWTIWSYGLEETPTGTRVTHERHAPHGTSKLSKFLVKNFMTGAERFETHLERGMNKTLSRIKAEVEAG